MEILRYWIRIDRETIACFHLGVPFVQAIHTWATNQMPDGYQELLAIDDRPGMNIDRLARALTPVVLGLGAHLQHQGNRDAFRLIPILRWLESNRFGNLITPQLLEKLTRARDENVSQATYL